MDRRLANEVPMQTWLAIAKDIQNRLTDAVIDSAVHQLPPEMFAISGNKIIHNLKKRRDDLLMYARQYYDFIAKEVDVPGSEKKRIFPRTADQ